MEKNCKQFEQSIVGRPNTKKTQISLFRNWVLPYLQSVSERDKQFAAVVVNQWEEQGLKPGTIRVLANILRKYIEWETGNIVKITVPRGQQEEVKAWSKAEAEKAINVCKQMDDTFYPILAFALNTGMRKGEIFGLRWGDADIFLGKIKVQRSYNGPTKNGKARVIPMTDGLAKLIESRYRVQHDSDNIFKELDVNYRLKRLCRTAKVPKITFHGLRHTFATLLLEEQVSPKQVQYLLGHSNVSTTLDLYWHIGKEEVDLNSLPKL
jgi:integrase